MFDINYVLVSWMAVHIWQSCSRRNNMRYTRIMFWIYEVKTNIPWYQNIFKYVTARVSFVAYDLIYIRLVYGISICIRENYSRNDRRFWNSRKTTRVPKSSVISWKLSRINMIFSYHFDKNCSEYMEVLGVIVKFKNISRESQRKYKVFL